jgi:hypothetical protein
MVAHVARTACQALAFPRAVPLENTSDGSPSVRSRLTVFVRHDVETVDDPDELLRTLTPEALDRFDRIEIRVSSERLAARVEFVRRPSGDAGVELAVWSAEPESRDDVILAARTIAMSLERGFRRYLGTTTGSENLGEAFRGTGARGSGRIASVAPYVLGALMGLIVVGSIRLLFPGEHVPQGVYAGLMAAVGLSYPVAWAYWIPEVEIAPAGRTRLRLTVTRSAQAVVALVLTAVLKALISAS